MARAWWLLLFASTRRFLIANSTSRWTGQKTLEAGTRLYLVELNFLPD